MWRGRYAGSGAARAGLSTRMRREGMNTLEIASASPGGLRVAVGGVLSLWLFDEFLSSIVSIMCSGTIWYHTIPCFFHQDIVCGFTGK
jgi:hypothetical protein